MSAVMRTIGYGVIVEKRHINDMLYALTKGLSLEQKKRFYIGHSVVDPISYEDMGSSYQELYDNVDTNQASFMRTDFGDNWMDYIDMYMDKHYPLLNIAYTEESDAVAVYVGVTRKVEELTMEEQSYEYWMDYEEDRLSRPTGALPLKDMSDRLLGLPSTAEVNVAVANEHGASIVINDEQRQQLSNFLQEAGVLLEPKVTAWTEYMEEDTIIFTNWQYGSRYPKEQNV